MSASSGKSRPCMGIPGGVIALLLILCGMIGAFSACSAGPPGVDKSATATPNLTATAQAQTATAIAQTQTATATAAPRVMITSPEGGPVPISITVQGNAQNIPKDEELWLFIQPSNVNSYFPQGNFANPLPITIFGDGTWSILAQIGGANDSGLTFTLIPVLINQHDQVAHNAIKKYFQQTGDPVYYGIQQTSGMHLLTTDQVRVVRT